MINIEFYRLITIRSALGLEIKGLKKRCKSAYSIIKEELGFKGNKQKVYNQIDAYIQKIKEKRNGNN